MIVDELYSRLLYPGRKYTHLRAAGLTPVRTRGVYLWPHRGERVWHTLLGAGPLHAPARALDRALGGGALRHAGRWILIESRVA